MKWNKETQKYISQIKKQMESLGVLEDIDIENLNMLGDAHHLYTIAMDTLDKEGLYVSDTRNRIVAHPCFSIVRSQQSIMISLFKELSISCRQRRLLAKDMMITEETPLSKLLDMV